jgi:hypothetical protein
VYDFGAMHPAPNVLTQVVIALLIDALVVALGGDHLAKPGVAVFGATAVIWFLLAAIYQLRRATANVKPSARRVREDRMMLILGVLAVGLPLATCVALAAGMPFDGFLFSSQASTVAGTLVMTTASAVLISSAADWYLITPFHRGVLNPEICRAHNDLTKPSRRRYAKWWIAHRGLCELIAYTSFSLFLAIVFTALTELVDDDAVLKISVGSFIGAGTAFALQGYLAPRVRSSWEYLNFQSAGLGEWAAGIDRNRQPVEGLVVDVSLKPGVQLRQSPTSPPVFVPLASAEDVQSCWNPNLRCETQCEGWILDCDRGRRERESDEVPGAPHAELA